MRRIDLVSRHPFVGGLATDPIPRRQLRQRPLVTQPVGDERHSLIHGAGLLPGHPSGHPPDAHPVTHVSGLICYLSIRFGPTEGLRPSDSPNALSRAASAGALRSRGSLAALARPWNERQVYELASRPVQPRGFAPRTPLHALSRAASAGASGRVARSRRSLALGTSVRFMSCLSTKLNRGASPLGLPYTLSRAPLRRRAPVVWLARDARSHLERASGL